MNGLPIPDVKGSWNGHWKILIFCIKIARSDAFLAHFQNSIRPIGLNLFGVNFSSPPLENAC